MSKRLRATNPNELGLLSAAWLLVRLAWGWELMLLTHEIGHLIAAGCTGAVVLQSNLLPWVLPCTLIEQNPHPHVVAWGGITSGVGIPIVIWGVLTWLQRPAAATGAGLAGFCLLANGAYLAAGGGESLTDTGVLRALGWSNGLLIVVGLVLAVPGYWLCRRDVLAQHALVQRGEVGWRPVGWSLTGWVVWTTAQTILAYACGAAGA